VILKVQDLDLYYGDAQALDSVSLVVEKAELVAIVGANGAGKSSLIRTIAGIEKPRAGRIWLRDQDITGRPSHQICDLGIGQVAEGRQIFPSLTVKENLEMGALLPRARGQMLRTMREVFELFPRLEERSAQTAGTLSGGEQQMLAIGRCLMGKPDLIMFDEPSLGLAPALVQSLFKIIRVINQQGLTVILVEQNVAASLRLADRAYVLENGRIVTHGTGADLLKDDRVRQAYLGIDRAEAAPAADTVSKPPFRDIAFAPPKVERIDIGEGGFLLRSPELLGPCAASIGHMLRGWAERDPDREFLVERDCSGQWQRVTYGEAWRHANAIAQAVLERGCSAERPVMVLSGNSIDHGLLMLGCFIGGVPIVPVSVAYSLMSQDHAKLRHIFGEIRPRLLYAAQAPMFAKALAALDLTGVALVVGSNPPEDMAATRFAELLAAKPGVAAQRAFERVGPDTIAKVLYTSGSTGRPKGVINTQRMLTSNQRMIELTWPFLREQALTLLDWLPWNHTFGANHNFNLVIAQGGTLYIDAGRPAPGLIEETIRNLREISPTIFFNVPAGFNFVLPYLENDEALARRFFSNLRLIFYAGAALSQDLWERLEALAIKTTGRRVPMVSSWGSTETAPLATAGHLLIERAGVIGLPPPGVELKFVPSGSKLEIRVKGPNVFPGYWQRPDLTGEAFDGDGFYRIGDAARLADGDDASKGIVFDGRVAEDFKLATGTWVHAGALRIAAIAAAAPLLQDAVVAGQDRDYVGLLAWVNPGALQQIGKGNGGSNAREMLRAPEVVAHVRTGLAVHNRSQAGSSMVIRRVMLMAEPPSIDANEITDKGYINQRAVLERRAALVEALYADSPGADVIVI
jgi:feruloyl-CoA synthase